MRKCRICGIEKDESKFELRKTGRYRTECKSCQCDLRIKRETKFLPIPKEGHKICRVCGKEKEATSFFKNKNSRDGLGHRCKECAREKFKPLEEGYKTCRICNETKKLEEFPTRENSPDGYRNECKSCKSLLSAKRKAENLEAYHARDKRYRENNPEKVKAAKKADYLLRRDEILAKKREYVQNNRESINLKQREDYHKNIEKKRAQQRESYSRHKEKHNAKQREWAKNNRDIVNENARKAHKKAKQNPALKLKLNIKRLFLIKLKNQRIKKTDSTFSYTGITMEEYLQHLQKDPLWKDYADKAQDIHIDHILGCANYDFTDVNEVRKCWNPRNLRLLPAAENIAKSDKILPELIKQYGIEDLLPKNFPEYLNL